MMRIFKFLFFFVLAANASGQTLSRKESETARQFAERVRPENTVLVHQAIETTWNAKPVIIAFYEGSYTLPIDKDPEQQEYMVIYARLFEKKAGNEYKQIEIGQIDSEGGDPNIESVFFANADKDPAKELIVIASWPQVHYDFSGTLYSTLIFDDKWDQSKSSLQYLEALSIKTSGGCNCEWRDGSSQVAKFKTADDVKKGLLKMGFKQ